MPKVIAIAGKGGVGKTTFTGMLVRYIVEKLKDVPVLAVDADPNSNLNELLGVTVKISIGDARELMKKDVPAGMTKDVWFEYKVNEAVIEGKRFDLLVMGRPEGPGCYCAANSLAKKSIDALKGNYAYVVVDNEAGMEHMSRLVTQDIDHLYVISDATPRGILTAKRILDLIRELNLNIKNTHVVINRLDEKKEEGLMNLATQNDVKVDGLIRHDEILAMDDIEGKTIFSLGDESVALNDAYEVFERTLNNTTEGNKGGHICQPE
ncbi:MAG: AAA family ATPase [Proteobacteria bacterium]|nr:AAA family ATPase [Pseudomonadota bacterium]